MIQFQFERKRSEIYEFILTLVNTTLPSKLTQTEITLLSTLMELPGEREWTTEKRKAVRTKLDVTEQYLNNYISQMSKKEVIVDNKLRDSLNVFISENESVTDIVFSVKTT